jgi:hypothetical protein
MRYPEETQVFECLNGLFEWIFGFIFGLLRFDIVNGQLDRCFGQSRTTLYQFVLSGRQNCFGEEL